MCDDNVWALAFYLQPNDLIFNNLAKPEEIAALTENELVLQLFMTSAAEIFGLFVRGRHLYLYFVF